MNPSPDKPGNEPQVKVMIFLLLLSCKEIADKSSHPTTVTLNSQYVKTNSIRVTQRDQKVQDTQSVLLLRQQYTVGHSLLTL